MLWYFNARSDKTRFESFISFGLITEYLARTNLMSWRWSSSTSDIQSDIVCNNVSGMLYIWNHNSVEMCFRNKDDAMYSVSIEHVLMIDHANHKIFCCHRSVQTHRFWFMRKYVLCMMISDLSENISDIS